MCTKIIEQALIKQKKRVVEVYLLLFLTINTIVAAPTTVMTPATVTKIISMDTIPLSSEIECVGLGVELGY